MDVVLSDQEIRRAFASSAKQPTIIVANLVSRIWQRQLSERALRDGLEQFVEICLSLKLVRVQRQDDLADAGVLAFEQRVSDSSDSL